MKTEQSHMPPIRRIAVLIVTTIILTNCSFLPPSWQDDMALQSPVSSDTSLRIAKASRANGDHAGAVRMLNRHLLEFPEDAAAHTELGHVLLEVGDAAIASESFRRAMAIDAVSSDRLVGIGRSMLYLGKALEAEHAFRDALDIDPRHYLALNGLGVAKDMQGLHLEAQASYRLAIDAQLNAKEAINNYALSLVLTGQHSKALRLFAGLGPADTLSPRIRQNIALAYGLSGNEGLALRFSEFDLEEKVAKNNLKWFRETRSIVGTAGSSLSRPNPLSNGRPDPFDSLSTPTS